MNRFGLCAFVISPLLMWGVPVLAKPPPNITESVAVCDPNSPSHCMAPSSSGGISLTGSLNLAPSGNAANAPVHFAFSTAASCYNVKLNPGNSFHVTIQTDASANSGDMIVLVNTTDACGAGSLAGSGSTVAPYAWSWVGAKGVISFDSGVYGTNFTGGIAVILTTTGPTTYTADVHMTGFGDYE